MTEAKRLQPIGDTLRELFLKSGNLCSFPGCARLMMNAEGLFVGQVCHIEAAEKGGERFNAAMTNEDRRAAANLMLMCYEHHTTTNDIAKYTVETLREFKATHEARFASPQRAILATLRDWTKAEDPTFAKNLRRMNRVLGWDLDDGDLAASTGVFAEYVESLRVVPIDVRAFLGKVVERAHRAEKTAAVAASTKGILISCKDVEGAFRLSSAEVATQVGRLDTYGLGRLDEIMIGERDEPAILVRSHDGWPIWKDLILFCASENVSIDTFTEVLNFSSLDE